MDLNRQPGVALHHQISTLIEDMVASGRLRDGDQLPTEEELRAIADFYQSEPGKKLLAQGPTATYGHIKTALRASFDNSLDDQLALEAALQGKCGRTADFAEGVTAFVQKRTAQFTGR